MKIVYYSPHPNLNFGAPSGPGTHMREMAKAFEDLGHEVQLCILGGETWVAGASVPQSGGLKQRVKPLIPKLLWHTLKDRNLAAFDRHAGEELQAAIDHFQPDLIYERGYYLMTSGVDVAAKNKVQHILEINAPYPEEKVDMEGRSLLHKSAEQAERQQFEGTSELVVVSSALADYYKKRYPEIRTPIVVTPNAIRNPKFVSDKHAARSVRQKWGIPETSLVIGFVGSIFPYHGVDDLIAAFTDLTGGDHHLLVVGGGAWLPELRVQAEGGGAARRIHFTDNVPHAEVAAHIAAMDITVMAKSNWYGSPVKLFEYGLHQKAIVAPDVVPVHDVMVQGEHGLLVKDRDSLLRAVQKLVNEEDLRIKLGACFGQKVRAEHTWKQMAAKVLAGFQASK